MTDDDAMQDAIDTLLEVKRIRDEDLTNTELTKRIKGLAKDLAGRDSQASKHGGIRKNVANAITLSFFHAPLDHL